MTCSRNCSSTHEYLGIVAHGTYGAVPLNISTYWLLGPIDAVLTNVSTLWPLALIDLTITRIMMSCEILISYTTTELDGILQDSDVLKKTLCTDDK
jgi:hypothetical protein